MRRRTLHPAPAHSSQLLFRPDITVRARLRGPEVEANRRGACLALPNAWQFPPSPPPPRPLPPWPLLGLPAAAMSASAVYVLDLKGKVRRAPHPPRCQATGGDLALGENPTLLLGNRPMGPTLVLSKEADRSHLRSYPVARLLGRGLRFSTPTSLLGNWLHDLALAVGKGFRPS